jgi:cytochrome c biogenesis protein CcmG/thiol:disulfide interchange protein DsbE
MPRFLKFLLPIALFAVLFVFLLRGLDLKPSEVPSPLIGKPAPAFSLPQLAKTERFDSQSLKGKVWLLNVWASWCVACREEHPLLLQMAHDPRFVIVGMDYKDVDKDALDWLAEHGNPYQLVVSDTDGRTGIDFGVYGVPETFVIDAQGTIRYKQIGPMTEDDLRQHVMPLLNEKS